MLKAHDSFCELGRPYKAQILIVKQKTNSDTNVKLQAPENLSDKLKKEFPPIQPKIALTRLADQQIQQRIQQQGIENDEHVQ